MRATQVCNGERIVQNHALPRGYVTKGKRVRLAKKRERHQLRTKYRRDEEKDLKRYFEEDDWKARRHWPRGQNFRRRH